MGKTILVFGAHNDDLVCYAGGTIARYANEGHNIVHVAVTDSGKGTYDPNISEKEVARIREEDGRRISRVLGVKEDRFWGYPDGDLSPSLELREKMLRAIRELRPSIVMTHDPEFNNQRHRDHIAVGLAAEEACTFSAFPLFGPAHYREGLKPCNVGLIYFFDTSKPNKFVDITAELEIKIKASGEDKYVDDMHIEICKLIDKYREGMSVEEAVSECVKFRASQFASEARGTKYAEAFRVVKAGSGEVFEV